jgi:3-deoxy-D-manno-octulosonate 8-phosphate phosphatase (KDO 8-P phosphatase)
VTGAGSAGAGAEREAAAGVRLLALDVDGVLTDGGIYLGATASGERVEMKRFDITDGLGIDLLRDSGVEVAIVTGRGSESVRLRAEELGIKECHQNASPAKLPVLEAVAGRLGVSLERVAFLGDDLADLEVLRSVGFPAAVANAVPEVREVARWVSARRGGAGAVRELAEHLLRARGAWGAAVERYAARRRTG